MNLVFDSAELEDVADEEDEDESSSAWMGNI